MNPQKPNILFLFSDQQRADTLGCYGSPTGITPHLDALAAGGVRFAETHSPQPLCGPVRACLQTGQWASRHGAVINGIALPTDRPLLAPTLRQAGYEVGYLGKWHLASNSYGEPKFGYGTRAVPVDLRGGYLDYWLAADIMEFTSHAYDGHLFDANGLKRDFPEGRYRADAQTDWMLEYLETRDGEKPWFCTCSWIEPHHQNDNRCFEGPHGSKERFKDVPIPGDLQPLEGDWPEEYADYLGCIASLDENVGRILAKLEELGMRENTLIVYASDHGCHFRTRNQEYKRSGHRASTHVPMIFNGPGFQGGQVVDSFTNLLDLSATLVRAAGAELPDSFDGRPLQELLEGAQDWPDDAFVQISESQWGRALRTREWCYSIDRPDPARPDAWVEQFLYDQQNDPHELDNRVADPALASVREDLRARITRRMRAAGENAPEITSV